MTLAAGTRLGPYEVLSPIGKGGMGEVYRARDSRLGREVAIKVLPAELASDAERLKRFEKEARSASSLNHPNIVTIYEIGSEGGVSYIAMERVEGQTLRELVAGGPLAFRKMLPIATQIAEGLAKAHEAGIVHRDLKPENVMVTKDGLVKILDFGLAKLTSTMSGSGEGSQVPTMTGTSPGVVVGTVGYMSPEQANGAPLDFRSDQFALGSILYEMATGRRAFQKKTAIDTLAAILNEDPEPVGAVNPQTPVALRWIVERCLCKEADGRYSAARDLAKDLAMVRDRLGEATASGEQAAVAAARRRPGRTRTLRFAGGAVALFAVLIAVPFLSDRVAVALRLRSIPSEKRLAILPFRAAGASEDDRALADGVSDQLTVRLTQLERFQKSLSVESTSNVRRSGVTSADAAAKALGANLVVAGSVQRVGGRLAFTGTLEDARAGKTLRADSAESLQELLDKVVGMLDLELGAEARTELRASGTGVAEAAVLSAQALGYTPYAEGRSALERYDQSRSLERAIELFNKALEHDPNYALAHAGLGEAYWRLYGNEKRPDLIPLAREHCERALALDGLLAPAWIALGMIETGTGNAEKAIAAFQRALDRDPRSAAARRELGFAFEKLGRFEEAEATYRKAIELRPDDWANYNYLGSFLVSPGGRAADAEPVIRKGLEIAPRNARLWSGLGATLYYRRELAGAKAAWERSIALFPAPSVISNLATMQFYEGKFADAASTLEKAVRLGTRDYRIWRNYAATLFWAPGERTKAPAAYRKAAELAEAERKIDPRNPLTLVILADCYAMLGDKVRARDLASEGLRIGPVDGPLAQTAAGVYEETGDRTEALRLLGVALSKGVARDDIERDPSFSNLRADPRWASLVAQNASSTR